MAGERAGRARNAIVTVLVGLVCGAAGMGLAASGVLSLGDATIRGSQATAQQGEAEDGRVTGTAAAVDPITAPEGGTAEPAPVVSVSPSLDMDLHSLDDPASPWVVVNKSRAIDPEGWAPSELDSSGGAPMVPEASSALERMRAAAADAGVPISVGSAYRAYGFQQYLYNDYVARWGTDRADRFSARPGHSEHQTGWAVDVYASAACRLKECFADEPAGQWIAERGHEFGFLVRYPPGVESVTGFKHEPWHLRYVGVELATVMHERGIATMEEFFSLPDAPDYG